MRKSLIRTVVISGALLLGGGVLAACGGGTPADLGASGTTVGTGSTATPGDPLAITLSEFHVAASATTLTAGQYTFAIANSGAIAHELLVFHTDLAPSALPMKDGDVVEDGPGVNLVSDGENVDPNGSQTRAVDLTVPGTYLLVCNIAGHFHSGMFQAITVT